jgi:hypothetical protein
MSIINFRDKPIIEDGYFGLDEDTFSDLDEEEKEVEDVNPDDFPKESLKLSGSPVGLHKKVDEDYEKYIHLNKDVFQEKIILHNKIRYLVMNTGYGSRVINNILNEGNHDFTIDYSDIQLMAVFDNRYSHVLDKKNIYYIHNITKEERIMIKSFVNDSDRSSILIYRVNERKYENKYHVLEDYFSYYEKHPYCDFLRISEIYGEYYSKKYRMYYFYIKTE